MLLSVMRKRQRLFLTSTYITGLGHFPYLKEIHKSVRSDITRLQGKIGDAAIYGMQRPRRQQGASLENNLPEEDIVRNILHAFFFLSSSYTTKTHIPIAMPLQTHGN